MGFDPGGLMAGEGEIAIGEFTAESGVFGGIGVDAVEVFLFVGGDLIEQGGVAGETGQLAFVVGDDGGGGFAELFVALAGELPVAGGFEAGGAEESEAEGGSQRGAAMAADEAGDAVPVGAFAGGNGKAIEVAAEVGGKIAGGGVAAGGIAGEGFADDGVEIGADAGDECRRRVGLGFGNFADSLDEVEAGELVGRAGSEHFVEHGAEGVDVAEQGGGFAEQLLGAGVGGGEGGIGDVGLVGGGGFGLDEFGDAEVENLGLSGGGDEDIGGF